MLQKRTWILILVALIALFGLQNTNVVSVRFLFWTLSMSQILLILILLALGILLGWLAHSAWQHRQRRVAGPPPPAKPQP
jgi:uncharacterized integral membrane protein